MLLRGHQQWATFSTSDVARVQLLSHWRHDHQKQPFMQSMLADHALLRGLVAHDLSGFIEEEMSRRKLMLLPPFGALAQVSGNGVDQVAHILRSNVLLQVSATHKDAVLVKSSDWKTLANSISDALTNASTRGKKALRTKTQIDPPRA